MQYRYDKYGNPISILGFGCMRFPKKGNSTDMGRAERQVMAAIKYGVNYFDTAYLYAGNEAALGEILAKNHCREKVNIATKLPQYLVKSEKAIDRFFEEELRRLQTDYIDYYLMHMLTDVAAWEKLEALGIKEWIAKKKEEGKIRQIGFSFHGNTDLFLKLIDAYDWDFCQIQYNYMDEHTQAGREGLQAAAAKGIPVIIMEPLRGGKLVDLLPVSAKKLIEEHPVKRTSAEWAFRWLWDQPEVTCVLSGMNTMKMLGENLMIADKVAVGEFTAEDFGLIEQIKAEIERTMKVGCTGCGYCMPCPKGIDIPAVFRCYNHMYTEKRGEGRHEFLQTVSMRKDYVDASVCVECGKCESHCPQHLPIREKLKEANRELMPLPYKVGVEVVRKLRLFW